MKKLILLCAFLNIVPISFAQKETFDLATYNVPKDSAGITWKKERTGNITSFTIINKKNNNWCRISIVRSTVSKGSIDLDFESEWKELIVKSYKPAEAPQVNEVQEADGWKIKRAL